MNDLIQIYVDLKTDFEAKKAEFLQLGNQSVPQAEADVRSAEGMIEQAKFNLRQALDAAAVRQAREAQTSAEENLLDARNLLNNMNHKVKQFREQENSLRGSLGQAEKAMWNAKRLELVEQLNISVEQIALLEQITVASISGPSDYATWELSAPVKNSLGKLTTTRKEELEQLMLSEMESLI